MHIINEHHLLIFGTAALPAVAASLHAIMTKQEVRRISAQSAITCRALSCLSAAMDALERANEAPWIHWLQVRHLAIRASAALSDENDQWQGLLRAQAAEWPA